jgi:hypothetical protein
MKMHIVERPQQGIDKAPCEYAPGRLIVINKETYRSGGVVANVLPTVHDRAAPLFTDIASLVYCDYCSFVRNRESQQPTDHACPVCGNALHPVLRQVTPDRQPPVPPVTCCIAPAAIPSPLASQRPLERRLPLPHSRPCGRADAPATGDAPPVAAPPRPGPGANVA